MEVQVNIEDTAPCTKRLKIEVSAEQVAAAFEQTIREFQKHATLRGFRPGRAPASMVERYFAQDVQDEVKRKLVPESYQQALTNYHLRTVGQPKFEELTLARGQPLRYTVTVETLPEFELPDYKGLRVQMETVNVTDEDVEKSLQALQEQSARFADVKDRAARMGDYLVVNYSAVAEGKPLAEIAPAAKMLSDAKDFWLLLGEDSFLPNFCRQLVGTFPGARQQVFVDFPVAFPVKELAGRKATYFVEVKAIKEKQLPPLDDAFAATFGEQSLEKLCAALRERIRAQRESRAKQDAKSQIVENLLGRVNFDLPPALLAQETRSVIYDIVEQSQARGATREQIEEQKDEILGYASKSAAERIKASFVLQRIAEKEKIEVTEAELNARLQQLGARYRVAPAQLKKQLAEHDELEQVREQLLIAKTLDFLLQNATVEPKSGQTDAQK